MSFDRSQLSFISVEEDASNNGGSWELDHCITATFQLMGIHFAFVNAISGRLISYPKCLLELAVFLHA